MQTITQGVRYLDLDGDGVPDAILITEAWPHAAGNDEAERTIVETLETGIGIDGRPNHVSVHAHQPGQHAPS